MIRAMHVRFFRLLGVISVMRAAFEIDIKTRREPNYLVTYTFIL